MTWCAITVKSVKTNEPQIVGIVKNYGKIVHSRYTQSRQKSNEKVK